VTLILFYVAFMIGGGLAAYRWFTCRVRIWSARKPNCFPGPLFLFSLGLLGARSLGNYTERCHIKCEMKAPG